MLELGAHAEAAHRSLVRRLTEEHVDLLIAVGPEMNRAAAGFGGDCRPAGDSSSAGHILRGLFREGDTVLVKGSRGMRMEKVLEAQGQPKEGTHAL